LYITSANALDIFADSSNYSSHKSDTTIHFTKESIDDDYAGSGAFQSHKDDSTIHFTLTSIQDDFAGSSNINRSLLDSISSNIDSRIDTLEGQDEFDHELYPTSSNIYNRTWIDALSGNIDARIDSIEADTFNHDLYITSSNSLSIFANSSNINDRFKASSSIWTFVSSQHVSGGLIRAQTSRGGSTYLPNLLTALEELSTDNLLDKTIGSLSCADDQLTYTITAPDGFSLINISSNIYPGIYGTASIVLGSGTATEPKTNYVYWDLVGTTPTLMISETHPEGNHVDAAIIQVGGVSGTNYHIYSYNKFRAETNFFINRVFHRFEHEGTLYVNGFYPSAGINNIVSIDASGNFFNGVFEMNADNRLVSSNGSYFFIKSDGSFNESNTLADLNEYSNGTALPDSHRQNIVWGIVPTTPTLNDTVPIVPKLVAVLQGEPTVPYTADATARQDLYDVINYYPPNDALKKVFVPIMRTIVKPNVPELRTFDDGIYFKDIRGRITVGGGAAAATDLSGYYNIDQTNQYYYPSSIGAGISSTVSTLVSFSSNAQLLYYPSSLGKSLYDWSSNALTLYGASSHIHDDRYYTEAESLSTFAGSSNINRALLDAVSGNILDKYYPSALGKGISSQVKTHIDDTTIHFTQANITTVGTIATGVWQGTAIDYNKLDTTAIPAISSNAIKGYRSGQLVVDTFIHDNYITSSNAISRFADSSNINSRFVASGVELISISSQSVSGGSILTHELTLMNADTISGLSLPQWPSSAVNKTYVDTISGNLDAKIGSIGYGCDTVADEGTIAHSLGAIPSWINLVPSGSSPIMYSCKVDDTNITVYHSSPDSEMFFWRVGV
jgi:hypothetical protein